MRTKLKQSFAFLHKTKNQKPSHARKCVSGPHHITHTHTHTRNFMGVKWCNSEAKFYSVFFVHRKENASKNEFKMQIIKNA
jgi:hypothetical protein